MARHSGPSVAPVHPDDGSDAGKKATIPKVFLQRLLERGMIELQAPAAMLEAKIAGTRGSTDSGRQVTAILNSLRSKVDGAIERLDGSISNQAELGHFCVDVKDAVRQAQREIGQGGGISKHLRSQIKRIYRVAQDAIKDGFELPEGDVDGPADAVEDDDESGDVDVDEDRFVLGSDSGDVEFSIEWVKDILEKHALVAIRDFIATLCDKGFLDQAENIKKDDYAKLKYFVELLGFALNAFMQSLREDLDQTSCIKFGSFKDQLKQRLLAIRPSKNKPRYGDANDGISKAIEEFVELLIERFERMDKRKLYEDFKIDPRIAQAGFDSRAIFLSKKDVFLKSREAALKASDVDPFEFSEPEKTFLAVEWRKLRTGVDDLLNNRTRKGFAATCNQEFHGDFQLRTAGDLTIFLTKMSGEEKQAAQEAQLRQEKMQAFHKNLLEVVKRKYFGRIVRMLLDNFKTRTDFDNESEDGLLKDGQLFVMRRADFQGILDLINLLKGEIENTFSGFEEMTASRERMEGIFKDGLNVDQVLAGKIADILQHHTASRLIDSGNSVSGQLRTTFFDRAWIIDSLGKEDEISIEAPKELDFRDLWLRELLKSRYTEANYSKDFWLSEKEYLQLICGDIELFSFTTAVEALDDLTAKGKLQGITDELNQAIHAGHPVRSIASVRDALRPILVEKFVDRTLKIDTSASAEAISPELESRLQLGLEWAKRVVGNKSVRHFHIKYLDAIARFLEEHKPALTPIQIEYWVGILETLRIKGGKTEDDFVPQEVTVEDLMRFFREMPAITAGENGQRFIAKLAYRVREIDLQLGRIDTLLDFLQMQKGQITDIEAELVSKGEEFTIVRARLEQLRAEIITIEREIAAMWEGAGGMPDEAIEADKRVRSDEFKRELREKTPFPERISGDIERLNAEKSRLEAIVNDPESGYDELLAEKEKLSRAKVALMTGVDGLIAQSYS